jgi:hypothetical protein
MGYGPVMPTLPTSLFWQRTDTTGCDHVLLDDRSGLRARGVAMATHPLPYTCRYELVTDPHWATVRVEVTAEGAGWSRTVRLERTGDQWRVPTSEQGNLAAAMAAAGRPRPGLAGIEDRDRLAGAVDVDLAAAPLFNTLPVRRLGLLDRAADGDRHDLIMAWVSLPSLEVFPSEQTYTARGAGRVSYSSDTFQAELDIDDAGYVIRYPGLAERVGARQP